MACTQTYVSSSLNSARIPFDEGGMYDARPMYEQERAAYLSLRIPHCQLALSNRFSEACGGERTTSKHRHHDTFYELSRGCATL
eukprot:8792003-Pyramimonas_sp.AAC.1